MKYLSIRPDHILSRLIQTPVRNKKQIIELLILTLKLSILDIVPENDFLCIVYNCNKHNRFFFEDDENRIFSISCPFSARVVNEKLRWFHRGSEVDYSLLSSISTFFESKFDIANFNISDEILDELSPPYQSEKMKDIICELIYFDYGYLRFDNDINNHDEVLHPRYHIDVNYRTDSKFKIGLHSMITSEDMLNIIDSEHKCYYLSELKL